MRKRLWAYNNASRSARTLGILRLRKERSTYFFKQGDIVINWGSRNCPYPCINSNAAVDIAQCKLKTLTTLADDDSINVPPFTTDRQVASQWFNDNKRVVCRELLRSHSGRGITLARAEWEMVDVPLYVQYVPKRDEYRVHVVNGEVIDVVRKMRNRDVADEDVNWQIRNHSNGFVFGRENVSIPDHAAEQAIRAVSKLGLDFGAVDMIYNEHRDKYYVLEINTAPGLEGTTIEKYKEAFNAMACI